MGTVAFDGLVVFCADVAASTRFYRDGLGLAQDWADEHHTSLRLPTKGNDGGAWLLLHPQTEPASPPHSLVTFTVRDLDALIGRLRTAGHRIVGEPHDEPWSVRQAEVLDPDGNELKLTAPIGEGAVRPG